MRRLQLGLQHCHLSASLRQLLERDFVAAIGGQHHGHCIAHHLLGVRAQGSVGLGDGLQRSIRGPACRLGQGARHHMQQVVDQIFMLLQPDTTAQLARRRGQEGLGTALGFACISLSAALHRRRSAGRTGGMCGWLQ
ncbi:hypothetical protein ACHFCA_17425 [Delftia tsuruhatensis]